MAEPPSLAGAVHPTVTDPLPAVALGEVGEPGTVEASGVADTTGEDAADWPLVLTAVATQ